MTREELNTIALSLVDKYDDKENFLIAQLKCAGVVLDLVLTKQGALSHHYDSKKVYFIPYNNNSFRIGCITRVWLTHDYKLVNLVLNEGIDFLKEDDEIRLLPLYNAELIVNELIKEEENKENKDKTNDIMSKYGLV